ncbi:thioredoxin family protein [Litorisediminicola beolgyonensis]|uniref:Thioredoxin family protein n=2 Tax=Litorisediminicola beolgyonensis TaxID=1173614 RepID=A0ABW3ZG27_9RHOB
MLTALATLASAAIAETRLVIVEQPGCIFCAQWNEQIAPAYPNTEAGKFAPLLRAQMSEGAPEGYSFDRRVLVTPTFILTEDGTELARMEGYPGEDFFWPLFEELLRTHTDFGAETGAETVKETRLLNPTEARGVLR